MQANGESHSVKVTSEPSLAPPGAGLPKVELWIGRALFVWKRRFGDRDAFNARFHKERAAIRRLVDACDPEAGATRVLIRRPRGLEDSSRHWSVWMTLDHLRIVNTSIARTISFLAKDQVPPGISSTADVKPSPEAGAAVGPAYERSCDSLISTVAAVRNLKTRARYTHPWFGPLDAFGWHCLAVGHMGLHKTQIERILARLFPKRVVESSQSPTHFART